MMKMRNWLTTLSIAFGCCLALVSQADAKVKLVTGQSKIDGVVITDGAGNPIATKRVHVIWRYEDTNLDGTFTWGGPPETGDRLRLVCRTIYKFNADFVPHPSWNGQLSTYHWGPLDPATGSFRLTAFRGTDYDDFLPGLPVPGTYVVTQGVDGPPVPGLSLTSSLFSDSGDTIPVPPNLPRWGIRYILSFALGTPRKIPAGTYMYVDAQLNMQHLSPDTCENGWSEEDWITTGGLGGFIQTGPNTAAPLYLELAAPPLLYVPLGHLCYTTP